MEVDETTGRIRMVEDEECVRQDIRLIVKTDQGERKMRSAFGAGLNQFMFQNVDLVLVNQMSQILPRASSGGKSTSRESMWGSCSLQKTGRR